MCWTITDMEKVDFCLQANFFVRKMSLNSIFFLIQRIFSNKNGLIVDSNAYLQSFMGKNCKEFVVYTLYKNVHNFFKNYPQAMLTCLQLFPCLGNH